jgi:hypothetical protein
VRRDAAVDLLGNLLRDAPHAHELARAEIDLGALASGSASHPDEPFHYVIDEDPIDGSLARRELRRLTSQQREDHVGDELVPRLPGAIYTMKMRANETGKS